MKRLGLSNILQNAASEARAMLAGTSRADASAPADKADAWHDPLAPRRLMADFFTAQHPVFDGVPKKVLDRLEAIKKDVMQTPVDEAMCQKLLAFMGNADAVKGEREDTGMRSDVACYMVFQLLHSLASTTPHTPREQAAFEHVLVAYRGYFASALVNRCYRHKPELKPQHADLQMRVLASTLSPTQAAMLHSGFAGHTTLTRVSMLSDTSNDQPPTASLMESYRRRITRSLGSEATAWLASHYQLEMTDAHLATPVVQSLITSTHALVHPTSVPGHARVTWRIKEGKTKTAEVKLSEVQTFLQDKQLLAVTNGLKATIHNGGSGARLGQLGTVRTYDQRLLIPLAQAQTVLSNLQSAKLDDRAHARDAMRAAAPYDGHALASVALSPAMQRQELGNCTVHSQKLCLLYALQHLRELGDPEALNAHEGAKLFARIWTEGFERIRKRLQDPQARRAAKHQGAEVQVEMAAMLAPKSPTEATKRTQMREPAAIERSRRPANYPVPAAKPPHPAAAAPDAAAARFMPHALPPRVARPATPATLAAWGAEAPSETPPAALLTWLETIKGKSWAPANIAESQGFDRLMAHLRAHAKDRATRLQLDHWIQGAPFAKRGRAVAAQFERDAQPFTDEALDDLRNFAFAFRADSEIMIQALPTSLNDALTKASQTDAFARHLRDRMFSTV